MVQFTTQQTQMAPKLQGMMDKNTSSSIPCNSQTQKHHVLAKVMHVDHYCVKRGMAVRTDCIILVKPKDVEATAMTVRLIAPPAFEPFMMSKTYKAFWTLAGKLQHLVSNNQQFGRFRFRGPGPSHLFLDQSLFVRQNQQGRLIVVIVTGILPDPNSDDSLHHHHTPTNPILNTLAGLLGILDLAKARDHENSKTTVNHTQSPPRAAAMMATTTTPTTTERGVEPNAAATTTTPVVVPLTRCDRHSVVLRKHDTQELRELGQNDEVRFELDDTSHDDAVATTTATAATTTTPVPPQPHVWYWPAGRLAQLHLVWHHNRSSPWFQMAVVGTALIGLRRAATVQIQLDRKNAIERPFICGPIRWDSPAAAAPARCRRRI